MKTVIRVSSSIICFVLLGILVRKSEAQFSIPSDTTTYYGMNQSGVAIPYWRGKDSAIYKGQLVIRFRQGALDSEKLMKTYTDWYGSIYNSHGGKGNHILSIPTLPCDSNRGFPDSLKNRLKTERFYIDSSTNIIRDSLLKTFLHSMGGYYLRRLTTASPINKFSVTRRGDTIGCDHYNWMVLKYDTATSPLLLSYLLTSQFPFDIFFAEPDRHEGKLLHTKPSHPHDNPIYYDKCQYDLYNMINAPAAWDYEIGNPKVLLAHFDRGVDYMHPDLGSGLGLNKHVKFGEQFSVNKQPPFIDNIIQHQGHGTPCMGIIGALTNRNVHSVAGVAGGWGVLPSDPPGTVDEGTGCSLAILAASNFTQAEDGISDYVASIFQASAKSDSSNYGYGVDAINTSAMITADDIYLSLHAAINFAFLNGVVQVIAMNNNDHDQNVRGIFTNSYPANYEEPWIIAVGGSQPNKTRISGSDYGYTMDMLAPAGDPTVGDVVDTDQFGNPIICSNNNNNNWNETFTIANLQTDQGLLEIDSPKHTVHGWGGNSAAAPHVTGSAGLLLSTFYGNPLKLEPEDVGGILKASAFRPSGTNSYQLEVAWGHLDIGHAYQMMDQIPDVMNSGNLYFLQHFHFEDSLKFGQWSDKRYYTFPICWDPSVVSTDTIKKRYAKWQYILNDNHNEGGYPYSYMAKVRTVSDTVTLPPEWVIDSTNSPLFAWGRSGGIGEKSGWSFSQMNWQTGWSRVTDCTGGDTVNEGIFHNQGRTFTVVTAQYDAWGWVDSTANYTNHIGHVPDDSLLGVNFSVFGRKDLTYSGVKTYTQASGNENLLVSVSPQGDKLIARYFSEREIEHPKLEIYDMLGRFMTSFSESHADQGWNSMTCPIHQLVSGSYICRVSGSGFTQSRRFQILK
ncbi:MAG: S8 family serine peptidase [Bacteroidota bacterium]